MSVFGWTQLHPAQEAVANSVGGSIPLDNSVTPTPTPDPMQLRVAAANASSVQGTNLSNTNSDSRTDTGAGAASSPGAAPGPADFQQYEKYSSDKNALFGDLVVGQGQAVAAGSVLTVAYRGWLTNGTLFDESYSSGKPFSFTEGEHRVIAGWEQGLFGMKAGGKRRLVVPPSAGYGDQAHGPIPAGAVMIFDVELLGVK